MLIALFIRVFLRLIGAVGISGRRLGGGFSARLGGCVARKLDEDAHIHRHAGVSVGFSIIGTENDFLRIARLDKSFFHDFGLLVPLFPRFGHGIAAFPGFLFLGGIAVFLVSVPVDGGDFAALDRHVEKILIPFIIRGFLGVIGAVLHGGRRCRRGRRRRCPGAFDTGIAIQREGSLQAGKTAGIAFLRRPRAVSLRFVMAADTQTVEFQAVRLECGMHEQLASIPLHLDGDGIPRQIAALVQRPVGGADPFGVPGLYRFQTVKGEQALKSAAGGLVLLIGDDGIGDGAHTEEQRNRHGRHNKEIEDGFHFCIHGIHPFRRIIFPPAVRQDGFVRRIHGGACRIR